MCISQNNSRRRSLTMISPMIVATTTTTTSTPASSPQQEMLSSLTRKSNNNTNKKDGRHHNKHFVKHNYHDHANDVDIDAKRGARKEVSRGGVTTPFPIRLHRMLDKIEEDGLAHIVSWQPHGRCFVVHKPKLFAEQVMPKYFKQSKFTSFQRQLNLYGFIRLTKSDKDKGGYYHEEFLRNKSFLAEKIRRSKIKGTGTRARSDPTSEPDFYQMAPLVDDNNSTTTTTPAPTPSLTITTRSTDVNVDNTPSNDTSIPEPTKSLSSLPILKPQAMPSASQALQAPPRLPVLQKKKESYHQEVPSATSSDVSHYSSADEHDTTTATTAAEDNEPLRFCQNCLDNDDDCVFEGKHFHYLDPTCVSADTLLSQTVISSQQQQAQSQEDECFKRCCSSLLDDDDDDGNNGFEFDNMPSFQTKQQQQQQDTTVTPPPSPADDSDVVPVGTNMDDPFTTDEIDHFLSDIKIPNYHDLMESIDDDVAFGHLLEKIIE